MFFSKFCSLITLVGALLFTGTASAQFTDVDIQSVTLLNPPATDCSPTSINASGMLSAANYIFNGATVNQSGSTITVTLDYIAGIVILPAFVPFSENVSLGTLPTGSYNVVVEGYLNGAFQNSMSLPLSVGSCCSVVSAFTVSDSIPCTGDSVHLVSISQNDTTLQWHVNGILIDTVQDIWITSLIGQPYYIELYASNSSCSDTSNTLITFSSSPEPDLGPDTNGCIGLWSAVILDPGSFSSYLWYDGSTSSTDTVSTAGQLWVQVTDSLGCTATDTINIDTVLPSLFVDAQPDAGVVCPGDSTLFDATGMPGINYMWSNGHTGPTQSLDAGTYYVTVSATGYCPASDSASATELTVTHPNLGPDTAACEGFVLQAPNFYFNYQWSGAGDTTQYDFYFEPSASGTVSLWAQDVNNCDVYDTVEVVIWSAPVFDLGPDTTICSGDSLWLNPMVSAASFIWNGDTVAPPFLAVAPGANELIASSDSGCAASQSIFVDTMNCASGLTEGAEPIQLSIFPNPSTGHVYFLPFGWVADRVTLTVLDSRGSVVANRTVAPAWNMQMVDLSNEPKGVYLFRVESGGGVWTKRVLIQ